jgi:hypothetical protein
VAIAERIMTVETWTVGSEHDEQALAALAQTLRELGYTIDKPTWGMAGSQEISTWRVHRAQDELVVETETYVGLSVSGERPLVDEVKQLLNASRSARSRDLIVRSGSNELLPIRSIVVRFACALRCTGQNFDSLV